MELKIDMENKCIRIDGELYDLAKRGDYINYTSEIIGEQVVKELNFIKAKIDKKIEYYQSDKHQPTKDNIDVAKEDKLHWQCGDKHYQSSGNVVDEGLKASEGNWSWISKDKGLLGFLFQKEDKSYEFVKEKSELGIPDWVNQFSVIRTSPQPKSESIREYEIVDYTINPYERINEPDPFKTHIKSVKRNSDGVVFSIGDAVVTNLTNDCKVHLLRIVKFSTDDKGVAWAHYNDYYRGEKMHELAIDINKISHQQPPSDKGEVIQNEQDKKYYETNFYLALNKLDISDEHKLSITAYYDAIKNKL